jgi:hypothetical protein
MCTPHASLKSTFFSNVGHETSGSKILSKTAEFRRCSFVIFWPKTTPCDFFLFPKMKKSLKGRRFTSIDDIKSVSLNELKAIPKI